MSRLDAVVIGGGAAGLAAARELSRAGARFVLLEARGRLGGRILTTCPSGFPIPIELGAEFIHGEAETTFGIADPAGLLIHEIPDHHRLAREGTFRPIPDFWKQITRLRARIQGGADRSFEEFLSSQRDVPARTKELARHFVSGYHAADSDRISALALRAGDEETSSINRQYRLAGGYGSLVSVLRAPIAGEIRLSTIVRGVDWSRGSVRVKAATATGGRVGPLDARALIVTVPIGVLKAPPESPGGIAFDPPLPSLARNLERIETGHVVKIILRFRERFWDDPQWLAARVTRSREQRLNFLHAPGEPIPTWWTSAPARTPILTGWSGGPAAAALAAMSSQRLVEIAIGTLARITSTARSRLERLLESNHSHDWISDPFSLGAYSWVSVGGLPGQKRLSRPIEGTIFLAGEATSTEETGTVAGAIDSGIRAARAVERALR